MSKIPEIAPPQLPFSRPSIDEETIISVSEVLRSGWITSGKYVLAFENAFAQLVGAPHAVAISSGTAGLDLAIAALGLEDGDEVIVPSLNWVSGPNIIELHGGKAVFCDVNAGDLQIDLTDAARRITPRTRAIMPVHFAGAACQLEALYALADANNLVVIEDAAHATGTQWRGRHIGSHRRGPYDCAVFSFHPSKNITTGEGGMITCHDAKLAQHFRLGRFHGIRKDAWKNHGRSGRDVYQVENPGRKYNLTDLQAVIGVHQLKQLGQMNEKRTRLALRYHKQLAQHPFIRPLTLPSESDSIHAWHIFVIVVNENKFGLNRDAVITALETHGIGSGLHFPPVHLQHYYADRYPRQSLPQTEFVGDKILSLPLFPEMSEQDVDRVTLLLNTLGRHQS